VPPPLFAHSERKQALPGIGGAMQAQLNALLEHEDAEDVLAMVELVEAAEAEAMDEVVAEAEAMAGPEALEAAGPLRGASIDDYLNVMASLTSLAHRSFRCFQPSQRVDVLDSEGQVRPPAFLPSCLHVLLLCACAWASLRTVSLFRWMRQFRSPAVSRSSPPEYTKTQWLSAEVVCNDKNFRAGQSHFDFSKLMRDVVREGLQLQTLLRLQALSGVHLNGHDADAPPSSAPCLVLDNVDADPAHADWRYMRRLLPQRAFAGQPGAAGHHPAHAHAQAQAQAQADPRPAAPAAYEPKRTTNCVLVHFEGHRDRCVTMSACLYPLMRVVRRGPLVARGVHLEQSC
jgi:hypothetical protein